MCQVFCSVSVDIEDVPVAGADLLFLEGESDGALGIASIMVLGIVSNRWVTMCFISSNSWAVHNSRSRDKVWSPKGFHLSQLKLGCPSVHDQYGVLCRLWKPSQRWACSTLVP